MPSGDIYLSIIEPYWDSIDISYDPADYLKSIEGVPHETIMLYAVHWCNMEVCDGGFLPFFYNSTAVLAPEALEGFKAMKLDKFAELLERAMSVFPDPFPRARADRWKLLEEKFGESWPQPSPFEALDVEYFDLLEISLVQTAADEYAKGL